MITKTEVVSKLELVGEPDSLCVTGTHILLLLL